MVSQLIGEKRPANRDFNLDEVIELKGHSFKIVLIDAFAGKLGLKWISRQEAKHLREQGA